MVCKQAWNLSRQNTIQHNFFNKNNPPFDPIPGYHVIPLIKYKNLKNNDNIKDLINFSRIDKVTLKFFLNKKHDIDTHIAIEIHGFNYNVYKHYYKMMSLKNY
jgi:hypothetical protein